MASVKGTMALILSSERVSCGGMDLLSHFLEVVGRDSGGRGGVGVLLEHRSVSGLLPGSVGG